MAGGHSLIRAECRNRGRGEPERSDPAEFERAIGQDRPSLLSWRYPRRAMGHLLGSGVRFGVAGPVMAAGEGIETMLSLRQAIPVMPMIAGLSAAHLAAIRFPAQLQRLYVARDADPAGAGALTTLTERAEPLGISVVSLEPRFDDFNSDLRAFGRERLAAAVRVQLQAADAVQFLRE